MALTSPIDEDAPLPAPPAAGDVRREFASEFLQGLGLEIGALHLRMWLPDGASARYVDRMDVKDLRHHYPELASLDLAPVDVVDDGERLATVAPESVDFIVANHFLEHCQDPITTITTHLSKLTPGGILFYAVPDKRYTFDFRRDRTPLQHVIEDHRHGPERSRAEHYLQWASFVREGTGPPSELQAQAYAHQLEAEDYSIHFHVWTASDLTELMLHIQAEHNGFELETVRRNGIENIIVLRKEMPAGVAPLRVSSPSPATVAPALLASTPDPRRTRDRISLASLREQLDASPAQSHWSIDPDGTSGRGLVQHAASRFIVPLTVTAPLRFEAQVRLLPHDWQRGSRAVRASVVASRAGATQVLWSRPLLSAAAGGADGPTDVRCEIPTGTEALILAIDPPAIRDPGSVGRAVWLEPALVDPAAPADRDVTPHAPSPPLGPGPRPHVPLISVLTPVHDPPLEMLDEAIASVRAQTFPDWELCLVDDGSRNPEVVAALHRHAESDPRIRFKRRGEAGGIADATNAALAMAGGEYVALLDHDDRLPSNAFELVAGRLADEPTLDMIYTDEAILTDGRITNQSLKPAWSPESLCSLMYTCHLGVYRRELVNDLGGLRSEFDGCQDYDLVLRLAEHTDRIGHIPAELYQWRAHAASTAGGEQAKPYAYVAQARAIGEHLTRIGVDASVTMGALPGMHRLVHRLDPAVCVVIATTVASTDGLLAAARSWLAQPHEQVHVVVAAPAALCSDIERTLQAAGVEAARAAVIPDEDPNPADRLSTATAAATRLGEHLIIMQAPCVALTREWLTALVGYSRQPGVALSGAAVLSPDGRIADAGVALPEGIALPLSHGHPAASVRAVAMNVSAVSGVVAVSAEHLGRLGELDPSWGPLALAELGVRAREHVLRVVAVPDARMQLTHGDLSDNDPAALWRLRRRWLSAHSGDPYYHPGYRTDRGDFTPRVRL